MATATAQKPKVKSAKTSTKAEKAPVEKKERAPKAEPNFSVADVWAVGKQAVASIRPSIKEFESRVADLQKQADADPKTYRDHMTALKYLTRRSERMNLSLTELETGLKERKPRAVKAEKPAKPAKSEAPPADAEDEDDDDFDDEEEDDDELE